MRGMKRSAAVSRLPHLSCQSGLDIFQLGCPAVPALVCKYPQSSELGNQSVSLKLNTMWRLKSSSPLAGTRLVFGRARGACMASWNQAATPLCQSSGSQGSADAKGQKSVLLYMMRSPCCCCRLLNTPACGCMAPSTRCMGLPRTAHRLGSMQVVVPPPLSPLWAVRRCRRRKGSSTRSW